MLVAVAAFARVDQVAVTPEGALVRPSATTFYNKNTACFRQDIRVYVDMSPSFSGTSTKSTQNLKTQFWTDFELKVVDKNGNIVYYATSLSRQTNASLYSLHYYHVDDSVRIFFWDTYDPENRDNCYGRLRRLPPNGEYTSIAEMISGNPNSGVVGVWVYPNMDGVLRSGKSIRAIFEDTENTVIVNRFTSSTYESVYPFGRFWRPARLERYGEIKLLVNP